MIMILGHTMGMSHLNNFNDVSNPGTTKINQKGSSSGSGCRGICTRFKAPKPAGGRYSSGQKRCQICEVFMETDEIWCSCCGYRLRSKPRNKKYKERLRNGKK